MIKLLAMMMAVSGFAMAEGCENGTAGDDGKCASCNEGFELNQDGACVEAAKTEEVKAEEVKAEEKTEEAK